MAMIDTAYSYYMTTYGQSVTSRYDTHKKSELRSVYNNILKINKEAPLFKINDPDEAHRFAIDIKEASKDINRVISSMQDDDYSLDNAFRKKVAVSSNNGIVEAEYIGGAESDENAEPFSVEVKELAKPQINTGNFITNDVRSLLTGEYSFDLETTSSSYEFQFTVNEGDTNRSIQERLSRLINKSNLGLNAKVIDNDKGQSAVEITSRQTGLMESEEYLFKISSDNTYNSERAMDVLGLGKVSQPASNSTFYLNDEEHHSYSNEFMINKTFELHLKSTGLDGQTATVGFKADADAIADNISQLTEAYNRMVNVARVYSGNTPQMNKLYNIINNLSNNYKNGLEPVGLVVNDDSTISIDKALLSEATDKENWQDNFKEIYDFKKSVSALANHTSLNPMDYVDKTVVCYKNPGKNLTAPYASSTYAGMLYDFAC